METARSLGINVVRVEEFLIDDNIISSTKVRNLLTVGDITSANDFLGITLVAIPLFSALTSA